MARFIGGRFYAGRWSSGCVTLLVIAGLAVTGLQNRSDILVIASADAAPISQTDLEFRASLGLNAGKETVAALVAQYGEDPALQRYGLTLSPAEQADIDGRVSRMPRSAALFEELSASFPESYGGGYTDQARGGVIVISFVGSEPSSLQDRIDAVGLADRVEVGRADFSQRILDATFTRASVVAAEVNLGPVPVVTGVSVDTVGNRVELAVHDSGDLKDPRLADLVGRPEVKARVDAASGDGDETPPRGGDGLDNNLGPACSVAFSGNQLYLGPVVITAGHCPNTDYVHMDPNFHWHGLPYAFEGWGGSADAQAHYPSGGANGFINCNFSGCVRAVGTTATSGGNYDHVGDFICIAGRYNRDCGLLLRRNATVTTSGITISNLRCATYSSSGGDSGAAIWGPNLDYTVAAVGVHKGVFATTCGNPNGKAYSFIGNVMNNLGITGLYYG